VIFPFAGSSGGGNGNASFSFLFHPVHGGGTFVHFTDFIGPSGIIENSFGNSGFTRIDMGNDTEIAEFAEVKVRHNAGKRG
jgi:hypothetical protein